MDFTAPSVARVHNTLLGGRDNLAADRALAAELTAICPVAGDLAAESRAFVTRAVTWAAQAGIGQYVDLGCGLPHPAAVHETARLGLVLHFMTARRARGLAGVGRKPA